MNLWHILVCAHVQNSKVVIRLLSAATTIRDNKVRVLVITVLNGFLSRTLINLVTVPPTVAEVMLRRLPHPTRHALRMLVHVIPNLFRLPWWLRLGLCFSSRRVLFP